MYRYRYICMWLYICWLSAQMIKYWKARIWNVIYCLYQHIMWWLIVIHFFGIRALLYFLAGWDESWYVYIKFSHEVWLRSVRWLCILMHSAHLSGSCYRNASNQWWLSTTNIQRDFGWQNLRNYNWQSVGYG